MDIREAFANFGLIARARSTRNNVAGTMAIGVADTTVTLPTENAVTYAVRLTMGAGGSATLDVSDGTVTGAAAGTAHVETATAAGTASGDGNVSVIITGSQHTSVNKTVTVAILNGDTASDWAEKVRTALAADTDINAAYVVSGAGADIVLTDRTKNNDSGFNIELTNGAPSPGITPDATSTTTTAGVASVVVEDDGVTLEGKPVGPITTLHAVALLCTGGQALVADATPEFFIIPSMLGRSSNPVYQVVACASGINAEWLDNPWEITSNAPSTTITIIVHGTTA